MEEHAPWLVGRIGKKCWLLAKDEKAFYLIEVGKNLDWETEEWLLRQGISEELLKELNLAFTYIPKKDIRGVAFSGCSAGDCVYLYLRSEKRKLTLELDYEQDWMDEFFSNLRRFTAPKRKQTGEKGWRKEYQDKETFEKLKFVPPGFMILCFAAGVGWLATRHWLLYVACLLLGILQIALAVLFPVYFTIFLPKGRRKQNVWNLDLSLWLTGVWLLLGQRSNWLEYGALRWLVPLGLGAGALICWRVRDFHSHPGECLVCLLISCFFTVYVAAQINMVFDFDRSELSVCQVEELDASGSARRGRNYYCTVTLPDGEELELMISKGLYRQLEEGDCVQVLRDIGALGIEYANVYPME